MCFGAGVLSFYLYDALASRRAAFNACQSESPNETYQPKTSNKTCQPESQGSNQPQKSNHKINASFILASTLEGISLALVIFIFITTSDISDSRLLNTLAYPVIFSATLLIFAHSRGIFSRMLALAPFVFLGRISYSIYLMHSVVGHYTYSLIHHIIDLGLGTHIIVGKVMNVSNAWEGNAGLISMLALVIFVSSLTYRYVELPASRLLKKLWLGGGRG